MILTSISDEKLSAYITEMKTARECIGRAWGALDGIVNDENRSAIATGDALLCVDECLAFANDERLRRVKWGSL